MKNLKGDEYVNIRLNSWAEWRLRKDNNALGYPSQSPTVRLMPKDGGFWTPEMDSAAFEMDRCVVALEFELKQVIMESYTKTSTVKQKAAACGIEERMYYYRLSAAKRELLGYLNDMAAGVPLPVQQTYVEQYA